MDYIVNERGGWVIPDKTVIPNNTVIPDYSVIGNSCILGNNCKLGNRCTLGNYCTLGNDCKLGYGCKLGSWCILDNDCTLGNNCILGNACELGNNCILEGVECIRFLTLANVDGSGRQVLLVKHKEGILVRAGCFLGTPEEFCKRAVAEGKLLYSKIIKSVSKELEEYES